MASSIAAARKVTASTSLFNKLLNPIRYVSTTSTYVPRSYIISPHMPDFNSGTPKYIINAQMRDFDDSTPNLSSLADSRRHRRSAIKEMLDNLDLHSQIGNSMPLAHIRLGTFVHCIEMKPGQGAKLVRSAGTSSKILKQQKGQCVLRLPSGVEKAVDSRCRATVGVVSNPSHGSRKLYKAGQSRWLGRRPHVRGVAMNPVDHPHGGGEGRTSGGRPSVTPWGKPTKAGYKTAKLKRKS